MGSFIHIEENMRTYHATNREGHIFDTSRTINHRSTMNAYFFWWTQASLQRDMGEWWLQQATSKDPMVGVSRVVTAEPDPSANYQEITLCRQILTVSSYLIVFQGFPTLKCQLCASFVGNLSRKVNLVGPIPSTNITGWILWASPVFRKIPTMMSLLGKQCVSIYWSFNGWPHPPLEPLANISLLPALTLLLVSPTREQQGMLSQRQWQMERIVKLRNHIVLSMDVLEGDRMLVNESIQFCALNARFGFTTLHPSLANLSLGIITSLHEKKHWHPKKHYINRLWWWLISKT